MSRTLRRAASRTEASQPGAGPIPVGHLTPEERERMVAEAAFFRAERRGFAPGAELDDWLEAELEIERVLGGGASEEDLS